MKYGVAIAIALIIMLIFATLIFFISMQEEDKTYHIIIIGTSFIGFLSTLLLAYYAITQNTKVLEQSEKLFLLDKQAKIKILADGKFKKIDNNENIHNTENDSVTFYVTYDDKLREYRENDTIVSLSMTYENSDFLLQSLILEECIVKPINDSITYYVKDAVKTDIINNPDKNFNELQILMISNLENEAKIKNFLYDDNLVIILKFMLKSSAGIETKLKLEVNFEHFIESKENSDSDWNGGSSINGKINNVSYNYDLGESKVCKKKKKRVRFPVNKI